MNRAGFILFFLVAVNVAAGSIYGTLRENNKIVAGVQITISGPTLKKAYQLKTAQDGSFRQFIPERGKLHFEVKYQGKSGDTYIFSYADPVKYDFDLKYDGKDRYRLNRR